MARWKYGNDGQLYYDQNDSGPDQGTPTPAQRASQGGEQGGYAPPTGGVSGYGGGTDPRTGQPMPFPTMPMPPGGFPRRGDPGWSGFDDPKPGPGSYGNPVIPIVPSQEELARGGQSPWWLSPLNGSIGQQGGVFGSGASMGSAPKTGTMGKIFGALGATPKAGGGGLFGGLFGGLGSLTKSAGAAIGADPSRRWY